MLSGAKAVLRETIHYLSKSGAAAAPCGEYSVTEQGDCVDLCASGGECDFRLSHDAFQQHVIEGRISLA